MLMLYRPYFDTFVAFPKTVAACSFSPFAFAAFKLVLTLFATSTSTAFCVGAHCTKKKIQKKLNKIKPHKKSTTQLSLSSALPLPRSSALFLAQVASVASSRYCYIFSALLAATATLALLPNWHVLNCHAAFLFLFLPLCVYLCFYCLECRIRKFATSKIQ